jgi:hypothetical protein
MMYIRTNGSISKFEDHIMQLEHELMIDGHEHTCPVCQNRAWPLIEPYTETVLR